jgi:hypothetical protein
MSNNPTRLLPVRPSLDELQRDCTPGCAGRYDAEKVFEYHVTALGWGRHFHAKVFVSETAFRLIEAHGGIE